MYRWAKFLESRLLAPHRPREKTVTVLLAGALTIGTGIRLWQYFLNPSLWMDEASLSLNVIERGFSELLQPLAYEQAAPPGFLWLQRLAITSFGDNEQALRLVPLLFGVAAPFLFLAVARRAANGFGLALVVALFCLSPRLIFHSVEAKQYSGDVFAALTALAIGLRFGRAAVSARSAVACGLVGCAMLTISHAATFAFGGVAVLVLIDCARRRDPVRLPAVFPALALWLLTVVLLFGMSYRQLTHHGQLLDYWKAGFAPLPWSPAAIDWCATTYLRFLTWPLGLGSGWLVAVALPIGAAFLFRRDRWLFGISVAPIACALLASALHHYPFHDRLLLFAVPACLLALGAGVTQLLSSPRIYWRWAGVGVAAGLLWPQLLRVGRDPARGRLSHELRPVLHQVAAHDPSARTFVVCGNAWAAFRYYAPRCGFVGTPEIVGESAVLDPTGFQTRLGAQHGQAWIVFSHVMETNGQDERLAALEILDRIAKREMELPGAGAFAYRYRFTAASAPPTASGACPP